jgi:hypothetical protein
MLSVCRVAVRSTSQFKPTMVASETSVNVVGALVIVRVCIGLVLGAKLASPG